MQKLLRFVSSFLGIFMLCSCVNILGWEKIITHDELQNEFNLKNAVWEADSYASSGQLVGTLHRINYFIFGSSFGDGGLHYALSCIETVRRCSSAKLRIWSEKVLFGIWEERIYYECVGNECLYEPSEKINRIILDLRLSN